jgi:3-hydroxyacyl-CoA dehydrogenase / enoyl-CoA hydratase / 3-hydroxybutyryl-CoA epimerase
MELSRDALGQNFKEEVNRFRATFKEDALGQAEKALVLEKRGSVGVLIFDAPDSKANKLSTPIMLRLFELLLEIEKSPEIGAAVVISKKPTIFIAGADIAEIQRLNSQSDAAGSLMKLQAVFTYLENLKIPTIAAIHGACLGGGFELSLACDYRMVTDAPETKLGLPEVTLGVLPGWGGTQRLPRLLGLEKALDMILSSKQIDGRAAKKMGIADKLVPKELLEEKAMLWAETLSKTKKKSSKVVELDLKEKVLETVPGGKWLIFDIAKKKLLEKTHGNYPAPLKALEVVKKTYGGKLQDGLKVEAEAFAELVATPESKNLIEIFYLTEKVKKASGTATAIKTPDIRHAGVLGAGVMGGGIARLFAAKHVRTRMKDVNWDAITKGYQAAYKIFKKQVERRKMKPSEFDNVMALIEGTTTWHGFKHSDLVVEAIVEDLEVKKKVFKELESATGPETILATNTSSLSVSTIASVCNDPKRVVGLHFFNPVDKMPLVEVVRGKETSDEAIASMFQFSKKLGKTPIVVKDSPGFVVNRILGPYLNEAVYLLQEGVGVTEMDKVMEKFGMPMGPCALLDEVGLDVVGKVSKVLFGAFGERMKPLPVIDLIIGDGRLGKKTGKGIYLYEKNGKRIGEDPTVMAKLGVKSGQPKLSPDTIIKRLTYVMINEAARCLEEGIVSESSDIDIGMIFGTGFAPFRGGLLRYADSVGIEAIVADLDIFHRNLGVRFLPSNYLQQLAVGGKKFYEEKEIEK